MEEAEARALEWRVAGGRDEAMVMGRRKEVKKMCAVCIGRAHLPSERGSGMFVPEIEVKVREIAAPSRPWACGHHFLPPRPRIRGFTTDCQGSLGEPTRWKFRAACESVFLPGAGERKSSLPSAFTNWNSSPDPESEVLMSGCSSVGH
jgi:hypothetical protein